MVETVVITPLAGLTSAPTCSCAIPGIPSIGDVILVNPRGLDRGFARLHVGGCRCDLSLGCLDLSFGSLELSLRGHVVLRGVVEILLGDGLLLRQRCIAFYVKLSTALIRFRHGHLRFGLGKLRLRVL